MDFGQQRTYFLNRIREVQEENFNELALEIFRWQAAWNPLYRQFLELLQVQPDEIDSIGEIPFLPISFFKNKTIKTGLWKAETVFESSGTSGQITSRHEVRSTAWYEENTVRGFGHFYGHPSGYCFLALLPSYLERGGSSLVLMADHFIQTSSFAESGFFLNDHAMLARLLNELKAKTIPTVLIGVSFGLLDFVEQYQIDFPDLIVMETGGMKGRRKEITRMELHELIRKGFNINHVHSEYGMTELFSQAYSKKDGLFRTSPTMKILIRDVTDPFCILPERRHGAINIIDLANLDTCAFVATDDLGRQYADNSFEILGRIDASDIRGCNLMVV